MRFWYIYDLSHTDFPKSFDSGIKDFTDGKYKTPGILKHVCGILIGLSKKKMSMEKSIEFIEQVAFGHLFNDSYAGLQFTEYQSKEFQEVSNILEKYQNDLEKEKIEDKAKNFLLLMKPDSRKFLWRLCLTNSGETQKFLEVPVLAQITPNDFIGAYLESPPRNRLDVHHTIKKLYGYPQFAEKLKDEIKWLKKVDSALKAKAGGLKQPTRYHVEEFRLIIESVVSKINGPTSSKKSAKKKV